MKKLDKFRENLFNLTVVYVYHMIHLLIIFIITKVFTTTSSIKYEELVAMLVSSG